MDIGAVDIWWHWQGWVLVMQIGGGGGGDDGGDGTSGSNTSGASDEDGETDWAAVSLGTYTKGNPLSMLRAGPGPMYGCDNGKI